MQIKISNNAQKVLGQVQRIPVSMQTGIMSALDLANEQSIGYLQARKLSQPGPDTLGVRSGRLRKSITRSETKASGRGFVSAIGTNVSYAAAHEFGTKPFTIRPVNKKMLRFQAGGRIVFARSVNHPGLAARRPFASTLEEREPAYSRGISRAIVNAWEGK
jgi:phage gpG-like protein